MTLIERKLVRGWVKANVIPQVRSNYKAVYCVIAEALRKDTGIEISREDLDDILYDNCVIVKRYGNQHRYTISSNSPFYLEFLPRELNAKARAIWNKFERKHKLEPCTHKEINNLIIKAAIELKISKQIAKEYCNQFLSGAIDDEFPNAPYLKYHCTPCEVFYETLLHLYRYARAKDDSLPDLI